MHETDHHGYTLIELSLVVALLGIILFPILGLLVNFQERYSFAAFEAGARMEALTAFNKIVEDFQGLSMEQMYPSNPVDSPSIEFKKIEHMTEDEEKIWGPKIRWEYQPVSGENAKGQLVRRLYDEEKNLNIITVVARNVVEFDKEVSLKGISFTKLEDGNLLQISLSIKKETGRYTASVHYQTKLRIH